jgi:hypothetical protein
MLLQLVVLGWAQILRVKAFVSKFSRVHVTPGTRPGRRGAARCAWQVGCSWVRTGRGAAAAWVCAWQGSYACWGYPCAQGPLVLRLTRPQAGEARRSPWKAGGEPSAHGRWGAAGYVWARVQQQPGGVRGGVLAECWGYPCTQGPLVLRLARPQGGDARRSLALEGGGGAECAWQVGCSWVRTGRGAAAAWVCAWRGSYACWGYPCAQGPLILRLTRPQAGEARRSPWKAGGEPSLHSWGAARWEHTGWGTAVAWGCAEQGYCHVLGQS